MKESAVIHVITATLTEMCSLAYRKFHVAQNRTMSVANPRTLLRGCIVAVILYRHIVRWNLFGWTEPIERSFCEICFTQSRLLRTAQRRTPLVAPFLSPKKLTQLQDDTPTVRIMGQRYFPHFSSSAAPACGAYAQGIAVIFFDTE